MGRDLPLRGDRAGAAQDDRGTAHLRQRRRAVGKQSAGAKIPGQAERNARAAGHQPVAGDGGAQRQQVGVADGIGHHEAASGPGLGREGRRQRRAAAHGVERHMPDVALRLPPQPAPYVGVGHRGQRMLLHAGFAEQPVADEEVTHEQPPPGGGKGRADDGHLGAEQVEQRLGDRPDIALGRRIEGRAVFEDDLAAALVEQPARRVERLADGLGGR